MADLIKQNIAELKTWLEQDISPVNITGLSGTALPYFFSKLLEDIRKPCLAVLPSQKEADRLYEELSFFMSDRAAIELSHTPRLYEFPPYDLTPLTGLSPDIEVVIRRLKSLYALITEQNPVIITSLEAVFLKTLPKEAFVNSLDYLEAGEDLDREVFIRKIEAAGYQRSSLVEEKGDYSVRGGVIDLFSPLYPLPIRLEFWGDRIESIRQFDPLNQRSQSFLKEIVLLPAAEIIMGRENIKRARSMGRLPNQTEHGIHFPGEEAWLNHFYPHTETVFQYLPKKGIVTLFDRHRTGAVFKKVSDRFENDAEKYRNEASLKRIPFPETEGILASLEEMERSCSEHQQLVFSSLDLDGDNTSGGMAVNIEGPFQMDYDLEMRVVGKGKVSIAPLVEKISRWISAGASVILVIRTEQQANRLRQILESYDVRIDHTVFFWDELNQKRGLSICIGRISKGFTWPDLGLYVICENEIFGTKRTVSDQKRKPKENELNWSNFSQLKSGDYVVHEEHGIGRYIGLEKLEIDETINDFVIVNYADNSRLYIPADRIGVLQKYAGADEIIPRLDKLGGQSWNIVKQKAKNSVKRIAKQLVQIYALRKYRKGHAFSPPDHYFREFEATFQHEETYDQIRTIENVIDDMTSDRPMDRLICGDVGFGKTEVAVRAAFLAVSDGKQAALLVPTTVLAEQHYETFEKRMSPYSIRIGILSRFKTRTEQKEVLGRLRSGKIDILVGTHRILQKDVKFRDLGLLIIDEEQRFGVKQKEILKKYRSIVDVLAITATPVPRTLQMSMTGVRDLSIIETPPEDRLSIQTYLSSFDESLIIRALNFEIQRGGQVFFVHNKVQTIEGMAKKLRDLAPGVRFSVAHGQMKGNDLENTMIRFINKEIDVLVCSTIIESGLDIPSANTIIINEADRLGLAQIYQLRGRVGRSKEKAYAYLLLSGESTLTKDAEKRLKALMDFSRLGAGLHLAMHDLKIRGSGNILGFAQSGHISAVGYELYLKLIEQAVAELKGEKWEEDITPEINWNITAFLPEGYVTDTDVRLNLYRRLSGIREKPDLSAIREEMLDRFGPAPIETDNLLSLMSIRLLLKKAGISKLEVASRSLTLTFSPSSDVDADKIVQIVSREPHKFMLIPQNRVIINMSVPQPPGCFDKIEKAIEDLVSV
ncbi:MAG: transcription-repair coupling factor [Deltaproteobacteria bacterium]|nr:transcription-repair coupling factor [Deltaproteobacteria bacterium]